MAHDAAIIDMDGTLYREGTAIDGAATAVSWLREQDLSLTAVPDEADVFVLSYTRDVDYDLLTEVLRGFDDDTLIATNPDQTLPGEDGPLPGTGTIVAACEAMLGEEAEVIGKPSLTAAETATSLVDAEPEGCLMIGDRCNTDIVMGENAGMTTVLVLTGVTDRREATAAAVEPDIVLDSIADLPDALDQNS